MGPQHPYTVVAYPGSAESTYLPRLLAELRPTVNYLQDRRKGLGPAIEALERGDDVVLHINWEEFVFLDCSSDDEAHRAREHFQDEIQKFRERRGERDRLDRAQQHATPSPVRRGLSWHSAPFSLG